MDLQRERALARAHRAEIESKRRHDRIETYLRSLIGLPISILVDDRRPVDPSNPLTGLVTARTRPDCSERGCRSTRHPSWSRSHGSEPTVREPARGAATNGIDRHP